VNRIVQLGQIDRGGFTRQLRILLAHEGIYPT